MFINLYSLYTLQVAHTTGYDYYTFIVIIISICMHKSKLLYIVPVLFA